MHATAPTNATPNPPALLDTDHAANLLGISRRGLEIIADRGDLPRVRIGRLVRFRPDDLQQFIAARVERRAHN